METTRWFDGKPAKIRRSGGTTEIFYGGAWGNIPGNGHGHVKAQGGERTAQRKVAEYLNTKKGELKIDFNT